MPATLRSVPAPSNVRRIEDGIPLMQDAVILLRKDVKKSDSDVTLIIALPAPCNARWDGFYCARFTAAGWVPVFKRDGVACRRPWNPKKPKRSLYESVLEEFEGEEGGGQDHRLMDKWLREIATDDGSIQLIPVDQAWRW